MIHRPIPGQEGAIFPKEPVIVRAPGYGILTTSYVLCQGHDYPASGMELGNGDIDIAHAARMTLWLCTFQTAGMTSINIQARMLPAVGRGAHTTLTDLASVDTSAVVTSATGGFVPSDVGKILYISDGTQHLEGLYKILSVDSATQITIDRDCGDGGNMSAADGTILTEAIECAMETPAGAGVTNLYQHEVVWTLSDFVVGQWYCYTLPLPAAERCRLYAKAAGNLTDSELVLGYTLMPPEGA